MKTEIEKMLEEANDGDLVELTLRENNVPRIKESFHIEYDVQITVGLENLPIRPGYGMGESNLIGSVVGYYGQWFRSGDNGKQVIIYPMSLEVMDIINSAPPIRIEVPVKEINSFRVIEKRERRVTPPRGFP